MKTLFEGEVVDVILVENGLIIAYICERNNDTGTVVVAYKMVTFTDGKFTFVQRSLYELSKFGANHKEILKHVKNHITSKALPLSSGKTFILERDGNGKLIDTLGNCIWFGTLSYKDNAPSSIAVSNRSMWTCFKESSVLTKMNLMTMKEELRIGGGQASPFNKPVDLFIDGNDIYVCNLGNNSIVRVNLNTYVTSVYREFNCKVYRYIKNDGYEFVVLESGIYLLD